MSPGAKNPPPEDNPARVGGEVPPADDLDPLTWIVPLACKDCGQIFDVPYRNVQAGVVFHCPHCRGSFVPTTTIHREVRASYEEFYMRRRREREAFASGGGDATQFAQHEARELEEFRARMVKAAHAMNPPGKLVRRSGIRAMFS